MIVLPAIDLRRGQVVRLRQGRPGTETVYGDDPAGVAHRWVGQGATWLHVVNLDGALGDAVPIRPAQDGHRAINWRRLEEIRAAVPGTSIQFGGGLRTMAGIALALELGATRVVLGTIAVQRPALLSEALGRFGPERVAVAIDVRDGHASTHGWQRRSALTAIALGRAVRRRGVRYVIYTDVARDGQLQGVNVAATVALARATGLHIIASGGVRALDDLERLRRQAAVGIEGVVVGQALYCGALSLPEALRVVSGGT